MSKAIRREIQKLNERDEIELKRVKYEEDIKK